MKLINIHCTFCVKESEFIMLSWILRTRNIYYTFWHFNGQVFNVLGIIIYYVELDSKNLKHLLHLLAFQWLGLLL